MTKQREPPVHEGPVDRLSDIDEPSRPMCRDERQADGQRLGNKGMGERPLVAVPELDQDRRCALVVETSHESSLQVCFVARPESGREHELASSQQIGGIWDVDHMNPPHRPPEVLLAGQHLGQCTAQNRERERVRHGERTGGRWSLCGGDAFRLAGPGGKGSRSSRAVPANGHAARSGLDPALGTACSKADYGNRPADNRD